MESREVALKNGKVWFGEVADRSIFVPIDYYVHVLPAAARVLNDECRIYLGLLFQSGHSSFGRLGCQFLPNDSGQLTIKVAASIDDDDFEISGIGLPREYARGVFEESVKLLSSDNPLGSGDLIFDRAEFHVVDSSPYIFRLLTKTILRLLARENQSASAEEINDYVATVRRQY